MNNTGLVYYYRQKGDDMENAQSDLQAQYLQLARNQRREQMLEDEIRSLLRRADRRRAQEPDDRPRWNRILNHLEHALDQCKARAGAHQRQQESIRKRAIQTELDAFDALDSMATYNGGETTESLESAVRYVVDEAEGSALNAAEEALLAEVASDPDPGAKGGELPPKDAAEQLRRRAFEKHLPPVPLEERRRRKQLRIAMDKILTNRTESLTLAEVDLVVQSIGSMAQNQGGTNDNQRLRTILSGFAQALEARMAIWRNALEQPEDRL